MKVKIRTIAALIIFSFLFVQPSVSKLFWERIITESIDANLSNNTSSLNSPSQFEQIVPSAAKSSSRIILKTANDERQEKGSYSSIRKSSGIYQTYTTLNANSSSVQKGEYVSFDSLTQWKYTTLVPVTSGNILYYDLKQVIGVDAKTDGELTSTAIATAFVLDYSTSFMAVSFNLSAVTTLVSANPITFYLTDNISGYQSDYLFKFEIPLRSYTTHESNPSSPLLFFYYDHPLATQVSNSLLAGTTYYAVLAAPDIIALAYSNDTATRDSYTVMVQNAGSWETVAGVDTLMSVYTGTKISVELVNSEGKTYYTLNTSELTGFYHRIAAGYYDPDGIYCPSSDFWDLEVIDPYAPMYLSLSSPSTVQYSDNAELIATVENIYHQPLSDVNVSFYYSNDNSTWSYIGSSLSGSDGTALMSYHSTEASGTVYFKAAVEDLAAFSSTQRLKEGVIVITPVITAVYGNYEGLANKTYFMLKVQVVDDDYTPISNVLVRFYYEESTTYLSTLTNSSGWALCNYKYTYKTVGLYTDSWWVTVEVDTTYYNSPETAYGDLEIVPNDLYFYGPSALEEEYNHQFNVSVAFKDPDGDSVTALDVEVVLYSYTTGSNSSLGIYKTDENGNITVNFSAGSIEPGDYKLFFLPRTDNYHYQEFVINLTVTGDQQQLTVNHSTSEDYYYNADFILEILVTDSLGNPLENVKVRIYVSYPDVLEEWKDIYEYYTNSSGYVVLTLVFNMNAGQQIKIRITTYDYYVGDKIYSYAAQPYTIILSCIAAPSEFTELENINCTNLDTVTIRGKLVSVDKPIANHDVEIVILNESFWVTTDDQGYFTLNYTVMQGGTIEVMIFFNSTNYLSTNSSIVINAAPASLTIITEDVLYTGNGSLTLTAQVLDQQQPQSGITLMFYYYDGEKWVLIGSNVTNEDGIAILISNSTLTPGDWQYKALIEESESFVYTESISALQVGLHTSIQISADTTVQYGGSLEIIVRATDEYGNPISVEVKLYLNDSYIATIWTNSTGMGYYLWSAYTLPAQYVLSAVITASLQYQSSTGDKLLTVEKAQSYINAEDTQKYYNETLYVTCYLYSTTGSLNGYQIVVTLPNGTTLSIVTNSSGYAEWLIPNYDPGNYSIKFSFEGNEYYYGSEIVITVVVNKLPSSIELNSESQYYTNSYIISGRIYINDKPGSDLNLTILINNTVVGRVISDDNGYYNFEIELLPGEYTITILFEGSKYISQSERTKTIYIWKLITSIQGSCLFEASTLTIGANLTANNSPLSSVYIDFYVNGSYVGSNITDENGCAYLTIEISSAGKYQIEVRYNGSDIYAPSYQTIVVEQGKLQTELIVTTNDGIYSIEPVSINITLTSFDKPLANQIIVLSVDGANYTLITNTDGIVIYYFDSFSAGTYQATITYLGDELYSAISTVITFNVKRASSTIQAEITYDNNTPTIIGRVIGGTSVLAGIPLNIFVNDSYYQTLVTDDEGEFSLTLSLIPSSYYILIAFEGNDNYLPSQKVLEVIIYKRTAEIIVEPFVEVKDTKSTITVKLQDINGTAISGEIKIIIDGNYYTTIIADENGTALLQLDPSLVLGKHSLTALFEGNELYYTAMLTLDFYVKLRPQLTEFEISSGSYGTKVEIRGKFDDRYNVFNNIELYIIINNTLFKVAIANGEWSLVLPEDYPAGYYNLCIKIAETERILEFEYYTEFSRDRGKISVALSSSALSQSFNNLSDIEGLLDFNLNVSDLTVEIYLEGELIYSIVTTLGSFHIPSHFLPTIPGIYNLTVVVLPKDDNLSKSTFLFQLVVLKDTLTGNITSDNLKVGREAEITIEVVDSQGNPVGDYNLIVTINETDYNVITNSSGLVTIMFYCDEAGSLVIKIVGEETEYYYKLTLETTVTISKASTSLKADENVTIYYNSSTGIKIILESDNGSRVANATLLAIINGSVTDIKLVTDKKGEAFLMLFGYPVGVYNVTIIYNGDSNYYNCTYSMIVEITKSETYIIVEPSEGKLVISLCDQESSPIANVNLTITFYDSDNNTLSSLLLLTSNDGTIVLNSSDFDNARYIIIEFKGTENYLSSELAIDLNNLNGLQMSVVTVPQYVIQASISIVSLVALLSLRHLLLRRKR